MTVVETGEFLSRARPLMTDEERADLVLFLAANPEAGDVIKGTGGIRKPRGGIAVTPGNVRKAGTKTARRSRARQTIGESIIEGLNQAIRWTQGEKGRVNVTLVNVPDVNVRKVRTKMKLSQVQFANRFGLPPATLRNWEQGRAVPDAPTRVLLAVIAKHPEAVEDALRKTG